MELTFEVPGRPQGKARPRATVRGGRVQVYTPEETALYEAAIRAAYCAAHGRVMLAGPVSLSVTAVFAVPRACSRKKQADCLAGVLLPVTKPDADNILKAVADALSGAAYADDRCVVDMRCTKRYGEEARLVVRLSGEEATA